MRGILISLSIAGLLMVAIVAPNLIGVFAKQLRGRKRYNNYQIKRSLDNLQRRGFVYIGEKDGKTVIKLTKDGEQKVLKYKLEDLKIQRQKQWDKKWRIVIFDIPEDHKQARNVLSAKLKEIGFVAIQKSVFVCPYPCEDEIAFLKEIYAIRPFVRMITAENLDRSEDLIKHFNLT